MKRLAISLLLILRTAIVSAEPAIPDPHMAFIEAQIAAHPGQSGVYVLDKGSEALIARAWLADHARYSIEVQYFIWSSDNIGILASEALLRAADRGVHVRVIVDDLLIDAPDNSLLALTKHPNIDIRIYNPLHSVGTPLHKRLLNFVTNFRGVNQRMHDKAFIVDGKVAITGGRNMAAEYFDYNHQFNFRDRDVLLLGDTVKEMQQNFETFWGSKLSVRVEDLYAGIGLMKKSVSIDDDGIRSAYRELHEYASNKENFSPEVRSSIASVPSAFVELAQRLAWSNVKFIHDRPGKNDNILSLSGGGKIISSLAQLVDSAHNSIVIQSPYLVMSDGALTLFRKAIARGVNVRINTNSLASTDNIQAFSGYRNQRDQLLKMGIEIYEYKPEPVVQRKLMEGYMLAKRRLPTFAIHAKSMVIDSKSVFIGTFNLDPRSENLNTEIGVIIHDPQLAKAVEAAIKVDMQPENSWNAAKDDPDQFVSFAKRSKVRLWQMIPIKSLL